jgi:hypothetical protein
VGKALGACVTPCGAVCGIPSCSNPGARLIILYRSRYRGTLRYAAYLEMGLAQAGETSIINAMVPIDHSAASGVDVPSTDVGDPDLVRDK